MSTAIDLIRSSNGQARTTATANRAADDALQEWLDDCETFDSVRLKAYELARDYYHGDHGTELTDRTREFLEVKGVRFAENFCEPMVDMVAERLTVTGFAAKVEGDDEESDRAKKIAEWLTEGFWGPARMDETQGTTHTQCLVTGDVYGIVGFDNQRRRPTFSFNPPERVKVVYSHDDASHPLYAVKRWETDEVGPSNREGVKVCRLNVYWPDRIEKWFKLHNSTGRGGWARWMDTPGDDGAPAVWPTPWVDADGDPLGIPVVHFRNKAKGSTHGQSELAGVMPQQNLLNKQILDLVAVMDTQGWPQRWVTGDESAAGALTANPGDVWKHPNKDAKFGQFDMAPLEPVLAAIEATIARMARRSGMPLHLITGGDMPSGESMKAAESRLVARCRDRAVSYGNAWEDAAHMAYRLAHFAQALPAGLEDVDPDFVHLDTIWDDPESRNEETEATTAEAWHRLGVSKHTLLQRAGFDPDKEADLRKAEADEAMNGALVQLLDGRGDRTEPPADPPVEEAA